MCPPGKSAEAAGCVPLNIPFPVGPAAVHDPSQESAWKYTAYGVVASGEKVL